MNYEHLHGVKEFLDLDEVVEEPSAQNRSFHFDIYLRPIKFTDNTSKFLHLYREGE